MRSSSKWVRFTAAFMTTFILAVTGPYQAAMAALVPTEDAVPRPDAAAARENIKNFLARQDAQSYLTSKGINPEEARARVESLTDAEAWMVSRHIENMPAGGDGIGIIVGAILLVFLILLITDLLGFTDVFPFVKKHL